MKSAWFNILEPDAPPLVYEAPKKGARARGCSQCPLNEEPGINKVLGLDRLKGRRAMLWGQAPGKDENVELLELVGRAGQWLWQEINRAGLSRDLFDIQNVVRCRPTEEVHGKVVDREPSKEEVHCCSYYTDQALAINAGRAEVHIVLGRAAAKALLGAEYSKDQPVFWSEKLSAMVFCLDHPSYFLRGAPQWRLREFRLRLKAASWFIRKAKGRYAFIQSLDLKGLTKPASVRAYLAKARASKKAVSVDIEEGIVKGKRVVLCVGLSHASRMARTIYLDHPENPRTPEEKEEVLALLKEFLEDPAIPKVMQYGCYDLDSLAELAGIRIKGYSFDSLYAHYLRYTFLKSHGLETIASLHFPLYAGYKDIIKPYVKSSHNFADIPMAKMTLYNGADASLTKEIEETIGGEISLPLLKIYTQTGVTLHRMESRGPKLDLPYFDELNAIIPRRLKALKNKLRMIADAPNLNPNAPDQIGKILYHKLKLPDLSEGKESTKENILEMLVQETDHPFPKLVLEYRKLSKMQTTYLRGYKVSADKNQGELRTKWYLAGAVTGRLRSGGSKEGIKGVINMQNLHGSPALQNLLISDVNWREALEFCEKRLRKTLKEQDLRIPESVLDLDVFLALDYSQIEIRMLAECSGDEVLIEQFRSGQDIHCAVGSTLNPAWSFDFIKKDKPTRTFVKNCHFGMVYGLDELGLFYYLKAKGVKTTERKVARFHRAYFKKYKGVARFIEETRAFVQEHNYVDTMFGFRRMIGSDADEDRTTNPENQAINSPIQGSAHTLLLTAMALLSAKPKTYNLLQAPLMEVHDALVFKVKLRHLKEAYAMAKRLLEVDAPAYIHRLFGIKLQVPLLAEGSAGFRYGTMVELPEMTPEALLSAWFEKNQKVEESVDSEYRKAA